MTTMNDAAPLSRAAPRPTATGLWTGLSLLGVVLVALTMRQAVAGVPPILADLGLDPAQAALLVAIPVLCFSLGALAGPALRRGLGEERAILAMLASLLVGLTARALWPGWALLPGTVLAGLSIAVLNVLLPSLVKRRFSDRIGLMMACYTMAMAVGSSLASGLTVAVLRAADGAIGVALGIWALPTALALLVWLPQLWAGSTAFQSATAGRRAAIWRYPLAWHVLAFMGMQSLLYYGPLSWLPAIYRDRGVDPAEAGILLMLFNGLGLVGNLAAPVIAARLPDQRPAVGVGVGLMLLGLLGVLLAPTSTALLWVIIMGVAQGSCLSLALLLIVLRSADSDTAAQLSGMAQSGGYLIAASGPFAMGLLHSATGDWTAPLLFLIGVAGAIWIPGMMAARNLVVGERARSG